MKKFLAMAVLAGLATFFVACDDKKADKKPQQAPTTQDASKPAGTSDKPADTTTTTAPVTSTDTSATTSPATQQDASKPAGTSDKPADTDKPSK